MRLASVLTPLSDVNLQLAAQCGVTDVPTGYHGPELAALLEVKAHIESFGLRLSVLEGFLPIENIKLGNDQFESDIEEMIVLLRNMASAEIPILCYNFMAGTDWVRTSTTTRERGEALVTAFDLQEVAKANSLTDTKTAVVENHISADSLWQNLKRFLERIIPIAEKEGIVLTMHPDDPPIDNLLGRDRIMNNVEAFERLVNFAPSRCNKICFCQGTFATMGVDVPATIRRLGSHIAYVHFRDVRGTPESFAETFHDNGQTDMVEAMRAYHEIGFDGPIRPDHVPQLVGEENGEPGYTCVV